MAPVSLVLLYPPPTPQPCCLCLFTSLDNTDGGFDREIFSDEPMNKIFTDQAHVFSGLGPSHELDRAFQLPSPAWHCILQAAPRRVHGNHSR